MSEETFVRYTITLMHGAALLTYSAIDERGSDEDHWAASSPTRARRIARQHAAQTHGQKLEWKFWWLAEFVVKEGE